MSWRRPACYRRPRSGWTRARRSGRTSCGRGSSGSIWTRRASGSWRRPAGTVTAVRARCCRSSRTRGKMQNPVTGSGGMLIGTVDEVGPDSPLGLRRRPGGDAGLADVDAAAHHRRPGRLGRAERAGAVRRARDPVRPVECRGAAGRPRARTGPGRVRRVRRAGPDRPDGARSMAAGGSVSVAVLGGAGKSGSLSLAAARRAGAMALRERRTLSPRWR